MVALGRAVTADDTLFELNDVLDVPRYPARYVVEDETIEVTAGDGTRFVSVRRGGDGTAPAAHAVNTTLTSTPLTSGGGAQRVRLLGPSRINFNTSDITTTGVLLPNIGALGSGVLVLSVYLRIITPWDTGVSESVQFFVSDSGLMEATDTLAQFQGRRSVTSAEVLNGPTSVGGIGAGAQDTTMLPVLTSLDLQYVAVLVVETGTAPTAGAADVYLLIAEPA